MKLSILVCLATVATFIAAVLGGGYVGHIVAHGSPYDLTLLALVSAVLASQVLVSGLVIGLLHHSQHGRLGAKRG